MKIGIPKEVFENETRVAVVPAMVPALTRSKHEVLVEANAGVMSSFSDAQYQEAGASIVADAAELYRSVEAILKFQPPQEHPQAGAHEVQLMREGAVLVCFLEPLSNIDVVRQLVERRVTSFAMDYVPRITRAQSMDALSSMATLAGYKTVVIAAQHVGKIFPLMMTAAGTIPPATVLILGAGVAGLQAIATAKRLGAKVEAFDPRPTVKEQVESLGAQFIEMELPKDVETAGGYAKEQPAEFLIKEQEAIAARLPKVDVVITTAQVFGKRAPLLITEEMVKLMRPGSLIVDLAADQGGNCALTEAWKMVTTHGVSIYGAVNLARTVPVHASQMYSRNIIDLFRHIFPTADASPDFGDEIVNGACITRDGKVNNERIRAVLERA